MGNKNYVISFQYWSESVRIELDSTQGKTGDIGNISFQVEIIDFYCVNFLVYYIHWSHAYIFGE